MQDTRKPGFPCRSLRPGQAGLWWCYEVLLGTLGVTAPGASGPSRSACRIACVLLRRRCRAGVVHPPSTGRVACLGGMSRVGLGGQTARPAASADVEVTPAVDCSTVRHRGGVRPSWQSLPAREVGSGILTIWRQGAAWEVRGTGSDRKTAARSGRPPGEFSRCEGEASPGRPASFGCPLAGPACRLDPTRGPQGTRMREARVDTGYGWMPGSRYS